MPTRKKQRQDEYQGHQSIQQSKKKRSQKETETRPNREQEQQTHNRNAARLTESQKQCKR